MAVIGAVMATAMVITHFQSLSDPIPICCTSKINDLVGHYSMWTDSESAWNTWGSVKTLLMAGLMYLRPMVSVVSRL